MSIELASTSLPPGPVSQPPAAAPQFTAFFLQVSHRIGAISLFALLATWGMMYMARNFGIALAVAFGCADVGLCAALIARMMSPANSPHRREANGAAVFNLILLALTLNLILLSRLEQIRSAASEFFTPNSSRSTTDH